MDVRAVGVRRACGLRRREERAAGAEPQACRRRAQGRPAPARPHRALARDAHVRLMLPDRGTRPWPVLYLLHGCCDSYQSWTRSTDVESIPALRSVLVVMPEGGDVGFYSNWRDGPAWETFHTRELPRL